MLVHVGAVPLIIVEHNINDLPTKTSEPYEIAATTVTSGPQLVAATKTTYFSRLSRLMPVGRVPDSNVDDRSKDLSADTHSPQ